jgi:hypothetical protein
VAVRADRSGLRHRAAFSGALVTAGHWTVAGLFAVLAASVMAILKAIRVW